MLFKSDSHSFIITIDSFMKKYVLFTAAFMLLGFSACRKKTNQDTAPTPTNQSVVRLSGNPANLGSRLVDANGNSLYYFANDANGLNNCSGDCANIWPIFFGGDALSQNQLGQGLTSSDFGTITTSGGRKQTTYKGWPLYYFAPNTNGNFVREAPGETKGENVGGVWFVAKPDYSIQLVNAQLIGHDGKQYRPDYTEGTGTTSYFTDDKGRTLYTFKPDSFNINKFTAADFSNNGIWPVYETDRIVIPSALDRTNFRSTLIHGRKQLTYKGWPLYYFGEDGNKRGANKGVSFPQPGIWPVPVKDMAEAPRP